VAELLLAPTLVQGASAPAQIVAALTAVAAAGVDLVLLVRGGGSLEDLWAFNDERVARAVAACAVPVVSGVGHEVDFSICDFAADLHAPTPSAAAELATPDIWELRLKVDGLRRLLDRQLEERVALAGDELAGLRHRLALAAPTRAVAAGRQRLEDLRARLRLAVDGDLRLRRAGAEGLASRLASLSPRAVLGRGYAHVRRARDGATVASTGAVGPAEGLRILVADGEIEAVTAGQGRLF
jgi:exodeoxyribonuclease VII large subunit